PEDAQFDGMPNSALQSGCVDIVADAHELPVRILDYITNSQNPQLDEDVPLDDIFKLLRKHIHHDFSQYKLSTICRRIERRMAIHTLNSLAEYARYLTNNSQELDLLFKELLIGVTRFFRDPPVWQYLADNILPPLLAKNEDGQFRIWVVGCSTGEEAYSIAMLFHEALSAADKEKHISLQIFATDLSQDAIAFARQGRYPLSIKTLISVERLEKFFTVHSDYYQIKPYIRESILFAEHDVILDPPFTKLDMLLCRNLLIYFDTKLQQKLLPLFHYSLNPNGVLLLGNAETVGRLEDIFTPLNGKFRFYQKVGKNSGQRTFLLNSFPPLATFKKEPKVSSDKSYADDANGLQSAADNLLLQVFSPAAVLINKDADIVYISGHTGKYLEPAAGKVSWNFDAMVHPDIRASLHRAINQASKHSEAVNLHDLSVTVPNGKQMLDVTVQRLTTPDILKGMTMVVFREKTRLTNDDSDKDNKKIGTGPLTQAAFDQHYREEIYSLRETARTAREELQAANEALQSMNEELQSANEELTTSKEEMQSMNEELQTINSELQSKLDDLALAQSDMQNVLNSTDIAILFLDQKLNVRRYTKRASKLINLRDSDVGRPLSDLTSQLQYPDLHADAANTLKTLTISEKHVATQDGRWFSVRIMPYRRVDNVIDGVVLTLVDISKKIIKTESDSH
ncbi:MAG TPA: CheR family methyltransferase, partial [Methylotenera sp.]|nr:CheR family methyltransferase [Methylotenera sp.]